MRGKIHLLASALALAILSAAGFAIPPQWQPASEWTVGLQDKHCLAVRSYALKSRRLQLAD